MWGGAAAAGRRLVAAAAAGARGKATLIRGGDVAEQEFYQPMRAEVQKFLDVMQARPRLVCLQVGDDPASAAYLKRKTAAADKNGLRADHVRLGADSTTEEVLRQLDKYNRDQSVHGLILQLPLPPHLPENLLCNAVDPSKDVDGFTAKNLGNLVQSADPGVSHFVPCTALAVARVIEHRRKGAGGLPGQRATVVGRSLNVGLPIALILQHDSRKGGFDLTTTVAHRATLDLAQFTRDADVLVSCVGIPGLIRPDMVKPGALVVDVGITRRGGKLEGDVDPGVEEVAGAMTPVPGGVGPCTVAALMHNTVLAARRSMLTWSV